MQEKHLFEYSIIRIVPRVEREEFINAGVILYCSSKKFLQTMFDVNEQRLDSLCCDIDIEEVKLRLDAFKQVCSGGPNGGPIGALPIASRFRWLTAARSTIVQSSPVHPGLCKEPGETLLKLYEKLVM